MKNFFRDESGFTLLEVIVSLSIASLCFLLISWSLVSVNKVSSNTQTNKQIEWHLFLNQMDNYLQHTELKSVGINRFSVVEKDDQRDVNVTYMHVNDKFIRRVNGGTQPLLLDVLLIRTNRVDNHLNLRVIFRNGEEYDAKIWVEGWEEDG